MLSGRKFEGLKGRKYVDGSFRPQLPLCLIVLCVHTSSEDICENMKHAMTGVEREILRMGLHVVHNEGSVDSTAIKAVVIVKGLVLHVILQSTESIFCRPTDGVATNLRCVADKLDE